MKYSFQLKFTENKRLIFFPPKYLDLLNSKPWILLGKSRLKTSMLIGVICRKYSVNPQIGGSDPLLCSQGILCLVLSHKHMCVYTHRQIHTHTHTHTHIFQVHPPRYSKYVCVCVCRGLPWWLSGKESACNARDMSSIPESGRSPGERSLVAYSPWGHKRVRHN